MEINKSAMNQSTNPTLSADIERDKRRLALKYRPLLVLFPEIPDDSERETYHRSGHSIGSVPPLEYDYHPRDIYLVLDHARIPPRGLYKCLRHIGIRGRRLPTEKLLKEMEKNEIDHIDLIDEKGPKDVAKFWRFYSKIKDKDDNYPRKAYARVIRGEKRFKDYISIQYWMAYFFDDWANVHEMDWEMVSVILKKQGDGEEPVGCIYNAHLGSFRKRWEDIEKADDDKNLNSQGLHPVAYIANGSHAAYFCDYPPSFNVIEKYVKPMLKAMIRLVSVAGGSPVAYFIDYVPSFHDKNNVKILPEVDIIPEPCTDEECPDKPKEHGKAKIQEHWHDEWRWLNFTGKWGSPVELTPIQLICRKIPII
ncbi:MAG: hypothetical protein HWN69_09645, partial [Desulfobacterales bacterium]|nr:hypothetical protein [Desulfobacterales bacterium]